MSGVSHVALVPRSAIFVVAFKYIFPLGSFLQSVFSNGLLPLVNSGLSSDKFIFEGFLPTKKGRKKRLEFLSNESRTIIIYESPKRILKTLKELVLFLGKDRKVSVSRELTKIYQENTRGKIEEVISIFDKKVIKGEIVLIIDGV